MDQSGKTPPWIVVAAGIVITSEPPRKHGSVLNDRRRHPTTYRAARAHLDVEDFEAARSDYEAVLARDKDMTEALIGQGDSCFGLGEYDAVRACLSSRA